MATLKLCIRCREDKPEECFYRKPSGRLYSYCRQCSNSLAREWYKRNRDRGNAFHREWRRRYRGLLCMKCNSALGLLGDDVILMESAIRYLSRRLSEREAD